MTMTKKAGMVFGIFLLFLMMGCAPTEEKQVPVARPTENVMEAQMQNGVQVATLSWGTLNYRPEVIKLKKDVPTRITGDMRRLTGCYRVFEIPDLKIEKSFSERNNVIEFTPTKAGTFAFGCAMGMGGGTLIVE